MQITYKLKTSTSCQKRSVKIGKKKKRKSKFLDHNAYKKAKYIKVLRKSIALIIMEKK